MVDNLCDFAADGVSQILCPLTYACMDMFYQETQIASYYAIQTNQIYLYISFAAITAPFSFVVAVFMYNCQELIHGWKAYDYIMYQTYRFSVREYRWMLRNPNYDESLSESLHSADLLCFSSQFYFILAILGLGLTVIILGIEGILRTTYNPLGDPCFLVIFILTCGVGEL